MKKFSLVSGVLVKAGIVLGVTLSLVGSADGTNYQSGAQYLNQGINNTSNAQAEQYLNAIRAFGGAQEELQKNNNWHDKLGGIKKAQGQVRARAQEEVDFSQQQLEGLASAAKNMSPGSLENGANAFQSSMKKAKHKNCKVNANPMGLMSSIQQQKDFNTQLQGNLKKETGQRTSDLAERAERARAEELARLDKLEKGDPSKELFTKMYSELSQSLKSPTAFVDYLKKQNEGLAQDYKKGVALLKAMILNKDGLVALLAEVEKNNQLLVEIGGQLRNSYRNAMNPLVTAVDEQINDAEGRCQENRNDFLGLEQAVMSAAKESQFHSDKRKRQISNAFNKGRKAICQRGEMDITVLLNQIKSGEDAINQAAQSGDATALFSAYSSANDRAGEVVAAMGKSAEPLNKACDVLGESYDSLKKNSGIQELLEASKSGDVNQSLAQGSGGPSQPGATPATGNVPALANPVKTNNGQTL